MTIQTLIRIHKWPFFSQNNCKTKLVSLSHLQPLGSHAFHIRTSCFWPTNDWYHNHRAGLFPFEGQKGTICKMLDQLFTQTKHITNNLCVVCVDWEDACGITKRSWMSLPLGYVSIMKPGEGHQSTSPGRLKFPDTTEPLKWSTVWANVFTHVCPDRHSSSPTHTHTQINNGSRCSFHIILSLSHSNRHV